MLSNKPKIIFSSHNQYAIVKELVTKIEGSLLDVGARDRKLKDYVIVDGYYSADIAPGKHDYVLDLEQPLPFEDRQFGTVVALDVLEHLEHIHAAMSEILRISNDTVVIGLPNLASYRHRISYLFKGRMATDKYDLKPYHQGDRHRWLVNMLDADAFVLHAARNNGFEVDAIGYQIEGGSVFIKSLWRILLNRWGSFSSALLITRGIYILSRTLK